MAKLLWKIIAKKYDQLFKTLYETITPLFTQSLVYDDNVIELGCGSGLVSFPVIPLVKEFVGVDIDEHMIAVAIKKLQSLQDPSLNAKFLLADASKSFLNDSNVKYDKVLLVNILHVVDSPKDVLLQAISLLKANASILIADFCHGEKMSLKYSLMSRLMNLSSKIGLMGTLWRFSFGDIEQLILDMGFRILRKIPSNSKFPFIFMEVSLNNERTQSNLDY